MATNNKETRELIGIGKPAVIPLLNALGAGDVYSQMTADIYIYILGEIGDKRALPILSEIVKESGIRIGVGYLTSPSFRESTAIALPGIMVMALPSKP